MIRRRMLVPVLVALAAPVGLGAQTLADYDYENLAFHGIGFDLGYMWPSKVEATPSYGLRIDLGFLGPGVRIVPTLGFWSSTLKGSELDRLADQLNDLAGREILTGEQLGPIDWSDLSLGVDGHYVWITPIRVLTYAGAGLGVHALNGQGESIEDTFVEDLLDSITAGVAVMGGIEYEPAPRLRLYGEARYTLMTDLHYPGLRLGAALMLPQPGAVPADRNARGN